MWQIHTMEHCSVKRKDKRICNRKQTTGAWAGSGKTGCKAHEGTEVTETVCIFTVVVITLLTAHICH